MPGGRVAAIVCAGVAGVTLALCLASPLRAVSGDTLPGSLGGLVYRCGGGFDLARISWMRGAIRHGKLPYWAQLDGDGHVISPYGPVPNLVGALAMLDVATGDALDDIAIRRRGRGAAAMLLAGCAALLAAAVGPAARPRPSVLAALLAAGSFAGGATLGQGLWQQVVSLPCLLAGFALVVRRDDVPRLAPLAPACLLASVLIRPTIGPLALGIGIAWIVTARRPTMRWILATGVALAVALPFVMWNLAHLGSVLPVGQWRSNAAFTSDIFVWSARHVGEGLAGLLVSPGRGLLWFAPVAVFGIYRGLRSRDRAIRIIAGAAIAQILFIALFYIWWGGLCFGPRFLCEVTWIGCGLAVLPSFRPALGHVAVIAIAVTLVVGQLGLWRWSGAQWEIRYRLEDDHAPLWQVVDSPLVALVTRSYSDAVIDSPPGEYRCEATGVQFTPRR